MGWRSIAVLSASIFSGLALGPSPCLAAEYWEVYVGPDRGVFVDTSSIQAMATADHKSITQITFSLGFPNISGSKVAYVSNDKEVDCQSRRVRDLSMTAFSDVGSILLKTKRMGEWQTVSSNPTTDRLMTVVCQGQTPAGEAVRFSEIKDARAAYLVKSSMMQLGK